MNVSVIETYEILCSCDDVWDREDGEAILVEYYVYDPDKPLDASTFGYTLTECDRLFLL